MVRSGCIISSLALAIALAAAARCTHPAAAGPTAVRITSAGDYIIPGSWNHVGFHVEPNEYESPDAYARLEVRDRAGTLRRTARYPAENVKRHIRSVHWDGNDHYGDPLTEAGAPYSLTLVVGDGEGESGHSLGGRQLKEWKFGVLLGDAPTTPGEWQSGMWERGIVSTLPFGTPVGLLVAIGWYGRPRDPAPFLYVVADYGERATGCIVEPRVDASGSFYIMYTTAPPLGIRRYDRPRQYEVDLIQQGEGVTDVADNPWDMDERTEQSEKRGAWTFAIGPEGEDRDFRESYWP